MNAALVICLFFTRKVVLTLVHLLLFDFVFRHALQETQERVGWMKLVNFTILSGDIDILICHGTAPRGFLTLRSFYSVTIKSEEMSAALPLPCTLFLSLLNERSTSESAFSLVMKRSGSSAFPSPGAAGDLSAFNL